MKRKIPFLCFSFVLPQLHICLLPSCFSLLPNTESCKSIFTLAFFRYAAVARRDGAKGGGEFEGKVPKADQKQEIQQVRGWSVRKTS